MKVDVFTVAAMSVKSVVLGLSLLLASQSGPVPRAKRSVFADIKNFVASVAKGNTLGFDREILDGEEGDWMAVYAADTRDGSGLLIMITTRHDPQWTRDDFEGEPEEMRTHGGLDVTVADEKVMGLGDDNHFIEKPGKTGTLLIFRKGVYHVRIWAASRAEAELAAWNVVTLIPSE
jgi:hypothetical protein